VQRPRSPQFGAILFRASELIGRQGAEVFDRLGIELDARKISIVLALEAYGPLSSSELSERIGHSRQVIEARLKPSVADGFFVSYTDPEDSRRRVYDFSDRARPIVERILSVMVDFEQVYDALWTELGVNLEAALVAMEAALQARDLTDRLSDAFPEYLDQIDSNPILSTTDLQETDR